MIRKFVLLALAAAALAGAPAPVHAETEAGFAFYEKQAKEILKSAGVKCWECAEDAFRAGFHQFAVEQAERALEFDPDQADAREYLKYEKKAGKWVQDAAAFEAMKKQNTSAAGNGKSESDESFQKRIKKWEDESLAKTNKYVAAKYAELGDVCAAKGHPDQAVKGYESAMRLDRDNEKARKGLGYTKFGKTWLTKKQDEARKAASKAVVVNEPETTIWEDLFKTKLNKIESAHFRIESAFPNEELFEHAKAAETAYAYYLADFGRDPAEEVFGGRRSVVVIMSTEEQWNLFVDRFGGPDKEFTRQLSGCGIDQLTRGLRGGKKDVVVDKGGGKTETSLGSSPESRRDHLVHGVVHQLNHFVWKLGGRAWLDEGLTYYYTLKVLESCLTHCVAQKKADYASGSKDEGGLKKWDDPFNWKPMLKGLVQKKDDLPLRTLMMVPLTKLDFQATVKGWSVASWLMDLDRDKFTSALDQMLDPAVKQENVFQGTYGMGLEDLDQAWQAYVKKSY
jgi:tetratricopeptide (TPR) repeat protein